MTITKTVNANDVTLALEGWLDTASAGELGSALEEIDSANALTLDFDKIEYIASAGLRQVVAASKKCKEMGATFSVINAGKEVMNIFKLTGLDKKMAIQGK